VRVRILPGQPRSSANPAISGLRKKAPEFRGIAGTTCRRRPKIGHFRLTRHANQASVSGRDFGISGIRYWPTRLLDALYAPPLRFCPRTWPPDAHHPVATCSSFWRPADRRAEPSNSALSHQGHGNDSWRFDPERAITTPSRSSSQKQPFRVCCGGFHDRGRSRRRSIAGTEPVH
jgi:hypothetical protein